MSRLRALCLALVCVGLVAPVRAGEKEDQQARALNQSGQTAFAAEHYQQAHDDFKKAYLIAQAPALLYNMATCLQRLGRPHDAAETLRAYLSAKPDDPERVA